jgi:hypothetical protein
MMGYAPNPYYAAYPVPQQNYYYPSAAGYAQMQPYAQHQNYILSQPQTQPQQPQPSAEDSSAAPSGMVAHESNGMVFYMPASEASQQPAQAGAGEYQPAESFVPSYAMPGLLPPTPGPEPGGAQQGFYYPSGQVGGFYGGGQ